MKNPIILGSIIIVFMLMMLPSISAAELSAEVESNKTQLIEQMQHMTIDEIREVIENLEIPYLLAIILSQLLYVLFAGPIRFILINLLYSIYNNNWSPSPPN